MQERHINREIYFMEQSKLSSNYVIPFIEELIPVNEHLKVLEIGCGEAGNLKPFVDLGCNVTGYDILEQKIENGKKFYEKHPNKNKLNLQAKNIYSISVEDTGTFDLIIMRDTIEHIPEQEKLMAHIKQFLDDKGILFIGFPPWRMPFGGHQQMCKSKFLSKLPYFHTLPKFLYVFVLKLFGEKDQINGLVEIYDTRISLNRFKRIIKNTAYKVDKKQYYLVNPNYKIKFNLKPRKLPFILNIHWFRDFFITTCYYVLSKKE
jgi:SAM-dependent methyltransferase